MNSTSYTEDGGGIPIDFCDAAANLLFALLRASGWEEPEGKHVRVLIDLVDYDENVAEGAA